MQLSLASDVSMACSCSCVNMLQKKVEETLQAAAMQANEMLKRQADVCSVLRTLDAGIKYGDENEAHLSTEARKHKARMHAMRSMCLSSLVRSLLSSNSTGTSFPVTSSRTCWRRRQLTRNKLATSYEEVGDVARPS